MRHFIQISVTAAIAAACGVTNTLQATQEELRPPTFMVLDMDDDGIDLTGAEQGVRFDLEATGRPVKLGWPTVGSDDALLVFDINKNQRVDPGELVGSRLAVAAGSMPKTGASLLGLFLQGIALDENRRPVGTLPEGAAVVDKSDSTYPLLMAWNDANHDGVAQPAEVQSLSSAGVKEIRTGFQRTSVKDSSGNSLLFRGSFSPRGERRTLAKIHS